MSEDSAGRTGEPRRAPWLPVAIVVGLVYLAAGVIFGALANRAASDSTRVAWRLAAWAVSAVVFGAHILWEQLRRRGSPAITALHASIGAALGGFGLAAAANIHSQSVSGRRLAHALALVLWPLLTGLPAFLVAWVSASGLAWLRRRRASPSGAARGGHA